LRQRRKKLDLCIFEDDPKGKTLSDWTRERNRKNTGAIARPAPETAETKEGRRRTRLSLSSFSLSEKRRKGGRFERSKRKGGKKTLRRRATWHEAEAASSFTLPLLFPSKWRKKKETKDETNCDQRLTPWSLLLSTPPLAASLLPTKVRAQSREREINERRRRTTALRERH
jgi:hypothetical protein